MADQSQLAVDRRGGQRPRLTIPTLAVLGTGGEPLVAVLADDIGGELVELGLTAEVRHEAFQRLLILVERAFARLGLLVSLRLHRRA